MLHITAFFNESSMCMNAILLIPSLNRRDISFKFIRAQSIRRSLPESSDNTAIWHFVMEFLMHSKRDIGIGKGAERV